jgi:hypothetical protein
VLLEAFGQYRNSLKFIVRIFDVLAIQALKRNLIDVRVQKGQKARFLQPVQN